MSYKKFNQYSLPVMLYDLSLNNIIFMNTICENFLEVNKLKNSHEDINLQNQFVFDADILKELKQNKNGLLSAVEVITIKNKKVVCNIIYQEQQEQQEQQKQQEQLNTINQDILIIVFDNFQNNFNLVKNAEQNKCLLHGVDTFTNDTYFYIDLEKSEIIYSGNIENKIIENRNISSFPEFILKEDVICPEDIPTYMKMYQNMKNNIEENTIIRMKNKQNQYNWYLIEYKILENNKKITGRTTNIQKQKELERMVKEDPLTHLLNKKAFEEVTIDIVENKKENIKYDLMIIDIDNFKTINDNLGHHFGDEVLKDLAKKLKKTFTEADYIARIGSNEFAVFIKYIGGEHEIIKKAQYIINLFNNTYKVGSKVLHITCSIGISGYSKNVFSYKEIYQNAMLSLYHAKRNGKNNYVIYNENIVKANLGKVVPVEITSKYIWQHIDTEIITEVRKILFKDKNFGMCIDDIIEYMTKCFNAEECYVAETINNGKSINCMHQFNNGIRNLEDDAVKYLSGETWNQFFEDQAMESVIHCDNIEVAKTNPIYPTVKENGVKSFLYSYNEIDSEIGYIVGFNFYENQKNWQPLEISTIVYITKLISELLNYVKRVTVKE